MLKLVQPVSLWAPSSLESDYLGSPMCLQHAKLCLAHSRCFINDCCMNERRSDESLPMACFYKVIEGIGAQLKGVCGPMEEHFQHEEV